MLCAVLLPLTGCEPARISTRQGLTAEAYSDSGEKESEITFLHAPTVIQRGDCAFVTVKARPDCLCDIAVHLSSGVSRAKGLEPKRSDENGMVSWTWTVGTQAKPGQYRITVTGGGQFADTFFVIE